jgi:hypothetical protein
MAMPVSRATLHLIREIVLICVASKCNGRMVGGLFKNIFEKQKNSLAILLDFF